MTSRTIRIPRRGLFADVRRSPLARNRAAVIGLVILLPIVIASLAPWILTSTSPNDQDLASSLRFPDGGHLLGTDKLGRDVWARIV